MLVMIEIKYCVVTKALNISVIHISQAGRFRFAYNSQLNKKKTALLGFSKTIW